MMGEWAKFISDLQHWEEENPIATFGWDGNEECILRDTVGADKSIT